MEGAGWRFFVGTIKTVVAIVSVPAWFLAWYFVEYFGPGLSSFATCDIQPDSFCRPGWGMPQFLTVATFFFAAPVLMVAALFGWHRKHTWFLSCVCAVLAGLSFMVLPHLLDPFTPDWWFAS